MSWSGTVRCRHCWTNGHNKRTCPDYTAQLKARALAEIAEGNREGYSGRQYAKRTGMYADGKKVPKAKRVKSTRRCKYCARQGHNRRTCPELKEAIATAQADCREYRIALLEKLQEVGLGVGALVTTERYGEKTAHMVKGLHWAGITHFSGKNGTGLINIEVLNKAGLASYQQSQMVGVPPLSEDDANQYRYEIVGPVSGSAVALTVPEGWVDNQAWATEYYAERESPNFYDNRYE